MPLADVDTLDLDVLLVDDGPLNRKLVTLLLESLGCRVATAGSGREGVTMALAHRYDVVFMDVHMPDVDGLAAGQEIRAGQRGAGSPATPIVVLTADEPSAASGVFDAFLSKPATIETLRMTIAGLKTVSLRERSADTVPVDAVNHFFEKAVSDAVQMRGALDRGDFATVEQKGHGLVGAGGELGFSAVTEIGRKIEKLARARAREEVAECLHRLDAILSL
jgi:CheY-like chemotaxis protein